MENKRSFQVIIIGGSYAGLSAAMALGRSLRDVLIIDSGDPCNKQTPRSHNFITQDGQTPAAITQLAKEQVMKYPTVRFINGIVDSVEGTDGNFVVHTRSKHHFSAEKILFATGLKDEIPDIKGYAECWGISILHCPYCHGYEVAGKKTGLLASSDHAYEAVKLISNWSPELIIFSNGKHELTDKHLEKIEQYGVEIIEKEIMEMKHENGYLRSLLFIDGTEYEIGVIFARPKISQHSSIPELLGCQLNEHGFIEVDEFQKTTIPGIYAAGDMATMFRSVPLAVASGTKAGALINAELINDHF